MSKFLSAITPSWLKYGSLAIIGLLLGHLTYLAYSHYTRHIDDRDKAQTALAVMTQERDRYIELSNANADAALRADIERKAAVAALEAAQSDVLDNVTKSAAAEADVNAATEAEDGPVATVLERLRQSRFGGSK